MTLNDLHTGDTATIIRIRGRGAFRKRITEMGFIRGKPVRVLKSAPLKDPVEYRILESNVSLRRSEAELIEVARQGEGFVMPAPLSVSYMPGSIQRGAMFHRPGRTIDVALVGNPNCGKTTLFNRASRSREHVGNYAGVTVDSKQATFHHRGYTFRITDLPGTYSLSDYSDEERLVREHILNRKPDVVVNVVDANNLERNLYLTSQLIDMDVTVVLALNMYDDLLARKDILDTGLLSQLLGIRVVPTISHRGRGIYRLLNHVIRVFEGEDPDIRHIHINYGEEIENSVRRLQELIRENPSVTDHYSSRFLSLKLLEKNDSCLHMLSREHNFHEIRERAEEEIHKLEQLFKEDAGSLITDARFGFIAGALKETMKRSGSDPGFSRSQRIDVPCHLHLREISHGLDRIGDSPPGHLHHIKPGRRHVQGYDGGRSDRRSGGCGCLPAQYTDPILFHLPDGRYRLHGPDGIHHGQDHAPVRPSRQIIHSPGYGLRL
jgi:ferrous iron transport protein B